MCYLAWALRLTYALLAKTAHPHIMMEGCGLPFGVRVLSYALSFCSNRPTAASEQAVCGVLH